MKLLAIDTTTDACSVGLQLGDRVFCEHTVEPRAHTRILLPMLQRVLDVAGIGLADVDAIVLGNGPGSFIGLRIGASVAQGLASGAGIGLVPVSSLAVVAAGVLATGAGDGVLVAQDARMGEVYLATFRRGVANIPEPIAGPVMHDAALAPAVPAGDWVAAGAGWRRYPELAGQLPTGVSVRHDAAYPRAEHLLRCGASDYRAGRGIDPADLLPGYLRERVARPPEHAANAGGKKAPDNS